MQDLLANRLLWTAVAADVTAQLLKALIVLLVERRWSFERLFGSGGMPSSHSAMAAALATGTAITQGFGSPLFAITIVLAAIVMYDAAGVRRAASLHAGLLNDLIHELESVLDEGFTPEHLKTLLGHTYPQVAAGLLLGVAAALVSFG
jgi:acid phosphatase family membrane protein YuiD